MKKYQKLLIAALTVVSLQACSGFIYRIDIPQGNYLEQKDVEKLRIDMTKEQVIYVLGRPVVKDSFNHDKWYYVYSMKRGMTGEKFRKDLVIEFVDDKVAKVSGDMDLSEDFNTPLEQ
ncbi:outer membrane protein assembly factor BamE [Neptunicella marina]|uniref:Outer membrane protein assembly factor BamE n=1 Tax=Neptunicella marina TaxID=2125989 RepID=A0A8J6IXI6_9ALTE|nr:outer membrane protein assembly factor BamE [Neptunicella marina]MBC3767201.1 outer membrane protein assembly factor BamE [Neptunicella marina]